MKPILDIRAVRPDLFTYSLGAARQAELHCEELFESAERCLRDAGEGLYGYFETAQIRFAGFALGCYPVARMVLDARGLFDELMSRVEALYRTRSVPRRLIAST
ncbi:MAG: hypothetical protein KKC79_17580 [Gammaproteobacteria bacterium]|nr:hypothetical protein [Gammaproteobacteria bacterium]MBU1443411.1 hypothetical protein [Gammaproteobacteria bacterium]MBU2284889.1 hypothetical protein [Gammaproteobacteria bacterium]MBU2410447.1 hypothetical protein [Gammaproteobacteria bacterium]